MQYAPKGVGDEVGVILVGNLFNTVLFGVLTLFAWGLQKMLERAPSLFYKIVSSYGLVTIFDFVLIAIVDGLLLVLLLFCWFLTNGIKLNNRTPKPRSLNCTTSTKQLKGAAPSVSSSLSFSTEDCWF
jgi:hypothetical protein